MIEHDPLADGWLTEYREIGSNFRILTDIRFKLLGLLPVGTVGGLVALGQLDETTWPIVALFGSLITVALFVYNERNNQLYGELVARAAELERELGLIGGNFNQRMAPWLQPRILKRFKVEHSWPVRLVYQASLAAWLFAGIAGTAAAVNELLLGSGLEIVSLPSAALDAMNRVGALVVSLALVTYASREYKKQEGQRRKTLKADVQWIVDQLAEVKVPAPFVDANVEAPIVDRLLQARTGIAAGNTDETVRQLCEATLRIRESCTAPQQPAGSPRSEDRRRIGAICDRHANSLRKAVVQAARALCSDDATDYPAIRQRCDDVISAVGGFAKTWRRLRFYLELPLENEFYPNPAPAKGGGTVTLGHRAAAFVAAKVIDLPARWMLDIKCGRR